MDFGLFDKLKIPNLIQKFCSHCIHHESSSFIGIIHSRKKNIRNSLMEKIFEKKNCFYSSINYDQMNILDK
ncbi:hypothetical protein BpHYR1_027654 [Brachionus plicatilis]|uniref:Uncharacterized protein n=1 Tax=Brachionus plicatilis TaxID=10195 RepID=A0A3M7S3R9_BRAPC|nr:hypothetical protein BpHYR1_027654 [Brachionus plicatilis]